MSFSSAVVIGLASQLAGVGNSEQFCERVFSPLGEPSDQQSPSSSLEPLQILVEAVNDSSIPLQANLRIALFVHNAKDESGWTDSLQTVETLSQIALDFEPVFAESSVQLLAQALESLEAAAVDVALVLSSDSNNTVALVICSESLAAEDGYRIYSSLEIEGSYPEQASAKINLDDYGLVVSATSQMANLRALGPSRAPSGSYFADLISQASQLFQSESWSRDLLELVALKSACLSTYLRLLPRTHIAQNQDISPQLPSLPPGVLAFTQARPWIHPVLPEEIKENPRRALVLGADCIFSVREVRSDLLENQQRPALPQSSELFLLEASTPAEILLRLQNWNLQSGLSLSELAFNEFLIQFKSQHGNAVPAGNVCYRLALVAASVDDLARIVSEAFGQIKVYPEQSVDIGRRGSGYCYSRIVKSGAGHSPHKVSFLFPGLGASYPNMLADLCFYFPEVRSVFDFVERLAVRANDKVLPSRAIFPLTSGGPQAISQALLATIDSAVVTLLLAQWALFHILQKLGIKADAFLGCSTGEFAVLAMNSCFDIFKSAGVFYRLSTQVSRSVSKDELTKLRTIRVSAPYDARIEAIVKALPSCVYLGAEMSNSCSLISGERSVMDQLCTELKKNEIDYLILPIAIPYHTPLVAGKIDREDDELLRLSVQTPDRESWSASLGDTYPNDPDAIRNLTMNLFEQPIQFRSTIEKMYDAGTRIFLEVAPKGGLIPYVSEILAGKPHRALACNLAERSAIDQLHIVLATLYCDGMELDLDVLFERRSLARKTKRSSLMVDDAVLNDDEFVLNSDDSVRYNGTVGVTSCVARETRSEFNPEELSTQDSASEVLLAYFRNLNELHANVALTQSRLMQAYLVVEEEPDSSGMASPLQTDLTESLSTLNGEALGPPASRATFTREGDPVFVKKPFLTNASFSGSDKSAHAFIPLSTTIYPFILDHAIGGNLSSQNLSSRVYLLPLMVAIEIMAEVAGLLFDGLRPVKLMDIRALKRIRVAATPTIVRVEAEQLSPQTASVTIYDAERENVLASCNVSFAQNYPNSPSPSIFAKNDLQPSRYTPERLYGEGSMFHGPLMQAVQSIDSVSQKTIEGKLLASCYNEWFSDRQNANRGFMIDPLIVDNLSQFVLYQMYEHDLPASALLPFHIASIDVYDDLDRWRYQALAASVHLRAMSTRGTLAVMQLTSPDGNLLIHVEEISSRAIMLNDNVRRLVFDPASVFSTEWNCFDNNQNSVITAIRSIDFPDDETVIDWLTDYVLTADEQIFWQRLGKNEKRRKQWLMGRIAAKDAVRSYYRRKHNREYRMLDLQLESNEVGSVAISVVGDPSAGQPRISISHCETLVCAIAEESIAGIDVEELRSRDEGFEKLAFTANEKNFLDRLSDRRDYICWSTAFWTAKEASAKAHSTGFMGNPKSFEAISMNKDEGSVTVRSPKIGGAAREYNCSIKFDFDQNVAIARVNGYKDC